ATQPTGQTCNVASGSGSNLSGNISTVSVNCTTNTFTLTYTTDGNGTISGNATQTNIAYGSSGTAVTALPNSGFNFDHWSDTNSTSATRTDSNVQADVTATAIFVPETQLVFTVDPSTVMGGSVTSEQVSIE